MFAFQTKLSEHSNGAGSSVKQPQPSVLPKVVMAYVFVLFIHSDLNKGQTFETDFVEILRIFLTSSLNLFHVLLINNNHQLLFLVATNLTKQQPQTSRREEARHPLAAPSQGIARHMLTHRGQKMDAISQTTISSVFSWMDIFEFRLKFHWRLFVRSKLTIFQHWLR